MVNYNMKNKFVICLVVFLFSACSSSDDSQGVISTNDLSTQTTVITIRSVLTPIFIAADEKGRTELFETIQICAEENNIPLGNNADFENPEAVADRLDTELEFAQCLRGKGIEVEDPSAERPLRPILVGLVQSGQYLEDQVREAAGECFDDLGLEPPQQGGG